jgi:4-diphosphocytidyl-2-C-methyl-D-erythritol kinase
MNRDPCISETDAPGRSHSTGKLTQSAPAKLNLALSVGPPDARGMHPICSWMVTITLCDELQVTRLEPGRLSRYAILWHEEARRRTEINWSIRDDLAVRAHLALERHLGRSLPVQLRMDKRIPVGGGLGGGSSDAAAMLHAVNTLYGLGLSVHDLASLSRDLGSDVPFFVHGGSAVVEGLGETVTRHEQVPQLHAVLIFPEASCPTGAVYRRFDELGAAKLRSSVVKELAQSVSRDDVGRGAYSTAVEGLFNDLTEAALAVEPALADVRDRVAALAERRPMLSGSGSTWFVLCDDAMHAEHLAAAIESQLELPAVAVKTQ